MDAKATSKEARTGTGEPVSLSLDNDFTFDGLTTQTAEGLNDSDSDGSVDSDIEDAIMAQLYFRDAVKKKSGKKVSFAKQLGSREVQLDHSADSSDVTSISFVMDSQRKRKRRQHVSVDHLDSPVVPQCGQARGGNVVEDTAVALGLHMCSQHSPNSSCVQDSSSSLPTSPSPIVIQDDSDSGSKLVGGEGGKGEGGRMDETEEESRCSSVRKKRHFLLRTPVAGEGSSAPGSESKLRRWGRKASKNSQQAEWEMLQKTETVTEKKVEREVESEGEGEEVRFVGVREMEEWEEEESSSSASGEDSQHSSDMELSAESAAGEGQLFLEVDEKDTWHIILKDVMGRDEYEKKYGGRTLGKRFTAKCFNCKQKSKHQANSCPHPIRHQVCYICAGYNHISSRCSEEMCTYCFQMKHKGKPCSTSWGRKTCQRCYSLGHEEAVCHEGWRQYHNTTSNSVGLYRIASTQQRQQRRVFCYNCGRRGHFGYSADVDVVPSEECSRERPRGFAFPLTPLIAVYDDSNAKYKRKRKWHDRDGDRGPERVGNTQRPSLNRGKGDGLLEVPPSLLGRHLSHHANIEWEERDNANSGGFHQHRQQEKNRNDMGRDALNSGRPRSQSLQIPKYDHKVSGGQHLTLPQTPLLRTLHQPSPPQAPHHYPQQRSPSSYTDFDCQITAVEEPRQTLSEPRHRQFPPERRFLHDPSHLRRSLHEEVDFPRTPLPSRRHPQEFHQDPQQPLLPPPQKLMRRDSEPFNHRSDYGSDQLRMSEKYVRYNYSHGYNARNSMQAQLPPTDYRRRSTGLDHGFRASERAVSLMRGHENFHHRRHSYGNQ